MVGKSKGRRKVEMVKMSNERTLQATFSKRRSGLFKKASELCTLCGVEIALIVFSPGNRVFSFGHPYVESILARFLTRHHPQTLVSLQPVNNQNHYELNMQLTQVLNELEVERKRGAELRKASQRRQYWWEAPIDELNSSQLDELKVCLKALREKVVLQAQKFVIQSSTPSQYVGESSSGGGILQLRPNNNNNMLPPVPPPSQYFVANSSTQRIIRTDSSNPSNMNVMPPPPSPHQYHPPQLHPHHPQSGLNHRFN